MAKVQTTIETNRSPADHGTPPWSAVVMSLASACARRKRARRAGLSRHRWGPSGAPERFCAWGVGTHRSRDAKDRAMAAAGIWK